MRKKKPASRKKNVPRNRQQATELVARIGVLNKMILAREAELNQQIEAHQSVIELAKVDAARDIGDLEAEMVQLYKGVREWGDANRLDLLEGEAKTFVLATGRCSWELNPPSVKTTRGCSFDDAVKELQRRRAPQYLRTVVEVDKEAILGDRKVFEKRGFTTLLIAQLEEFAIRPDNEPVELSAVKGAKIKIKRDQDKEQ